MINYLHRMIDMLTGAYTMDDLDKTRESDGVNVPPFDVPSLGEYDGKTLTPLQETLETNIGKLFSIHGGALHMLHEQADKVLLWDDIDYARGKTLDRYGENFGVSRQGATDPFYRLLIKVKMLSQLSGGDINTVINAASILMDVDPHTLELEEVFPAKVYIYIDRDQLTDDTMRVIDLIWKMLHRIVAAGIWLKIWLRIYSMHEYDIIYNAGAAVETDVQAQPALIPTPLEIKGDMYVGGMVYTEIQMRLRESVVTREGDIIFAITGVITTEITTQIV